MQDALIVLGLLAFVPHQAVVGPSVGVVVGPGAPKLEQFAADEIASQFKQLFNARVTISDKPVAGVDHLILVGSPATNPAVAKAMGDRWPRLTEQGHVLRSVTISGHEALVAGGGSPVATLWSAYELGHHFGIRPLLQGDVLPEKLPELKLGGIDITLEPVVRVRAWRVLGPEPTGFGAWGQADHEQLLKQLAKLKFNRVVIGLDLKNLRGIFEGRGLPVGGDTPGRKAFRGAKVFDNPDLAGKTGDVRAKAVLGLADTIARYAKRLGMTVGESGPELTDVTLRGFLPHCPAESPIKKDGFLLVAEVPGDLSAGVYHLARHAFNPKLTVRESFVHLYTPGLGVAATERVILGLNLIEEATRLIEKNNPEWLNPSQSLVSNLIRSGETPPEWWKKAAKLYAGGMDEMYRAIRATFNDPVRPLLLYHAKRCEFAVHFFAGIEATRLAGLAKAKKDTAAVVQHLEKATESVYNALTALGDVARDPSDRGVIAVLTESVYRPLKAELKAAEKK